MRNWKKKVYQRKMLLGEASRWEPLYTLNSGTNYSYVIQNYFDETYNSGKYYLGDLKHVPKILCAHSYHTDKNMEFFEECP